MSTAYLTLDHVIALHDTLIEEFGGSFGLRDKGLLESAITQPMQSFGGEELFPTVFDKAAAYAFFISENQPFLDGNKRTAATVAAVFLDLNAFEVNCPVGGIFDVMMKLANKEISRDDLVMWFRKNSVKKTKKSRSSKT